MSIISTILEYSKQADVHNPERTSYSILAASVAEMGELAEEVAIHQGGSYKQAGKDGVVGEGVDVIVAVVDLLYSVDTNLTEDELQKIVVAKCEKWMRLIREKKKPE